MSTVTMIAIILAVVAIAAILWIYFQKQKTQKLRTKFGPEYDRLVEKEQGNVRRAEAVLDGRQKRVSKFDMRPLNREECDRFAADGRSAQEHFVDDPRKAVSD